ncbi:MAG: hypothetical protein WAU24_09710 [Chitinophagaceae bacterium]
MQDKHLWPRLVFLCSLFLLPFFVQAQVSTVTFGKNRLQYKKYNWQYYQSRNFNAYFNGDGEDLGKYVVEMAEQELPELETAAEYSLRNRANFVIYNNYDDFKSSNIGLGIDWQNSGGLTKLVNNKVVLFYDGNKNNLKEQIRQGIAKILVDNLLFGDDLGEIASNQALLDLPQWLTDGYVEYIGTPWSAKFDDDLKSAILGGDYNSFYQFAFDKPVLAGHAFWYYISERYKPQDVTYFLYLTRLYKNLNTASEKIAKKKFKYMLQDFMDYEQDRYAKDIKQRRNAPKGKLSVIEEIKKGDDFYHFAANPNPKNNSYAVVQYTKGKYGVKYVDNLYESKTILDYGVRTLSGDINPNYPILSWDGKGSRLLVIYSKEGKIHMFVYDVIANIKRFEQEIEGVDQVIDAGFMLDANTLLMSAVKNGHSDIFIYKIDSGKFKQLTNDQYDDLDPNFVSFPNRTGIIFSSNRPGVDASKSDTALPGNYPFNIYLIDLLNNSDFKQISKLTDVKFGNARYPMQYNLNHFTYVSDENGIANRWAGFFSTQRDGIDTIFAIGEDLLRNPDEKELDSTLRANKKTAPDSVGYFAVYKDSTYTFPITNYQSSLLESRVAGNNGQVSEVRREGDLKFLYKLKVDSIALRKRNINPRPTEFMRQSMLSKNIETGKALDLQSDTVATKSENRVFQNQFNNGNNDSAYTNAIKNIPVAQRALEDLKLYKYKLKFNSDYVLAGVSNSVIVNNYQPYNGGYGPISLSNGNDINFTFRVGVSDLMEDIKLIGGYRFGTSLSDKDAFISFQNYRKMIDWGVTYYRSTATDYFGFFKGPKGAYDNRLFTSIYQFNIAYPLNEVKSIRASVGYRTDRGVVRPFVTLVDPNTGQEISFPDPTAFGIPDSTSATLLTHLEYVHDNSINPAMNIWNGLRFKIYGDFNMPMGKSAIKGKTTVNLGFDARYYYKIYRNFIWATRAAGDFSFGEAKLLYYLGGADGWINPKFNDANRPAPDQNYAFQSLALNMRGYIQNVANGNNAMVINSELRLPVFSTFFNKPINNAFLRTFQLIQFVDLGTAWNGGFNAFERPTYIYPPADPNNPVSIRQKAGGIGPFAGGYGFGARGSLLGYFLKLDAGWPMTGFFQGKPIWYFALGLDF